MSNWVSRCMLFWAVTGCAVAAPPRAEPPKARAAAPPRSAAPVEAPPAEPVAQAEPEPEPIAIPTSCARAGAEACVPPGDFVRELCKRGSTDLALVMFKKGTPWTRAYLRRDMEAWYTGARLASPAVLQLDEEVIVIANRASGGPGELSIGPGSYDVLRWDGKCVSVMSDEVTLKKPPLPSAAEIAWRRLDDETQDALLADARVKLAWQLSRDRCRADRGAPRCEEATAALSRSIADYVRSGGDVPEPKLVMW